MCLYTLGSEALWTGGAWASAQWRSVAFRLHSGDFCEPVYFSRGGAVSLWLGSGCLGREGSWGSQDALCSDEPPRSPLCPHTSSPQPGSRTFPVAASPDITLTVSLVGVGGALFPDMLSLGILSLSGGPLCLLAHLSTGARRPIFPSPTLCPSHLLHYHQNSLEMSPPLCALILLTLQSFCLVIDPVTWWVFRDRSRTVLQLSRPRQQGFLDVCCSQTFLRNWRMLVSSSPEMYRHRQPAWCWGWRCLRGREETW